MIAKTELTGYPSIDQPWLKYYTEKDLENKAVGMTVFENIYQNNKEYQSDCALVFYGKKISYKELFKKIEAAENAFLQAGVKEGDNVAFLMLSCPEMVYAILALNKIGACANMINPTFTVEQMRDRINDTEANLILILDQLYDRLKPVLSEICSKTRIIVPIENSMSLPVKLLVHGKLRKDIPIAKGTVLWNSFVKAAKANALANGHTYKENMPAVMVYSSGTTGASKGIVLTNEGINGTIAHYDKEEFTYKRGDTFLHMGAPWLSTLMVVCMLMPLQKGITVIIEPIFSEETFYKGILKNKPTFTLSTISHWLFVMNHEKAANIDFSNMKYPITGGEKVLPETERALNDYLRKQGCSSRMFIGYGMCELGSTAVTTSNLHFKEGSPGYPITGVTVAAFDIETNAEKKYGERGEIRVLTPNRMKEYYKRPDATSEFFWTDAKGQVWGCTGDMGYVDEDGFVYVEGRSSDSFISQSGKKVYCFDIEDVILKQSAVHQCEVIGVPCKEGYERPYAFVVLEKERTDSIERIMDQIMQRCEKELDSERRPYKIEVLEKFIIKPSGKRDMELLKKIAEEKNKSEIGVNCYVFKANNKSCGKGGVFYNA